MDIFEEFFDNIVTAKHPKQTVIMMREILQMLIEETQHCPTEAIQMLMQQFTRKRKVSPKKVCKMKQL